MPDFGTYPIGSESLSQDESESIFENKSGLAEDLKFLASMPELCDVTFLVGETREPVCAVKVRTISGTSESFLDFLPIPGHSGIAIKDFPQTSVPTASFTSAQEQPAQPSTCPRKQTSPLPQTILRAALEPPERIAKGNAGRVSGRTKNFPFDVPMNKKIPQLFTHLNFIKNEIKKNPENTRLSANPNAHDL
jgi:hypothetical protein